MQDRVNTFIQDPKKALYTIATPIAVSMFVQAIYNLADTIFIGRLGPEAIAGLTFAFPLFFILIALSGGISAGMGSRISRFLGERKKLAAENTVMHGLILTLIISFSTFVVGILTLEPIMKLLGAEGLALQYGVEYMQIIFLGSMIMLTAYVFITIFTAQGDTRTPMKIQIYAMILNIILDPIFIYYFGWGVRGAALATVASFILSFCLGAYYVITQSSLKLRFFKFSLYLIKDILKVGVPASIMMLFLSVNAMVLTKFISSYGVVHVAAFGIVNRVGHLLNLPIISVSIAMVTLVGMFYGANEYQKLKEIVNYGVISLIKISVAGIIILFIFAKPVLYLFTNDPDVLLLTTDFLRIMIFQTPFFAISLIFARALQGMGQGLPSLVVTLSRTFLSAIPMAYVFVYVLNSSYLYVPLTIVIGSAISALVSVWWFVRKVK